MTKLMIVVTAGAFIAAFATELVTHKRKRPRFKDAARQFREGFMEGLRDETVGVAP